jgi:hypothetical protein
MRKSKEKLTCRANLVINPTVAAYIKKVSEDVGISESYCFRAACNLLIRHLEKHGIMSLQEHLKDVTHEEIVEGSQSKKVVNLSTYRSDMRNSAYVFGCFSIYLFVFEFLRHTTVSITNYLRKQ